MLVFNPINPVNANQSEWNRSIRFSPNDSEKFGFIRIDSDWPDLLGLYVRINSD